MIIDPNPLLDKLQNTGCLYAFYFAQKGDTPYFRGNCDRFLSASIIKIPILLAWVYLERLGEVHRSEWCCLDDEPQVQGAGFSWLLRERHLPFQDVLLMMMALSDNLCTNLVIQRLGIPRLRQVLRDDFGLPGTEIQRKLMDYEARARGLDNWVSAKDAIRYYELFSGLTEVERAWVEPMLLACQDNALLMRNIPRDTIKFHHKTGSMNGVLHDWGYTLDRQIFLFTNGVKVEADVVPIFGELGRTLEAVHGLNDV